VLATVVAPSTPSAIAMAVAGRNLAHLTRQESPECLRLEAEHRNASVDRRDRGNGTSGQDRVAHAPGGLRVVRRLEPLREDGTFEGDDGAAARERG
jgi:hypothetical protein